MAPLRRPAQDNPRVQRTRRRILAVARQLLPGTGPAGLTYSLLADRAGVTRQTLYRHWPTRDALLVDLILDGPDTGYPEPGSDLRAVVTAWLISLRAGITSQATRAAVLAVTARSDADPDSAQALIRLGADRLRALNKLLEPAGRQITDEEYTRLCGPVLSRVFFDRREVTDEFIDATVAQWLAVLDNPAAPAGNPASPDTAEPDQEAPARLS
jgi:AcrR family transcriptional regulator